MTAALPQLFPGAITDVAGLRAGHYTDSRRPTGCSVVLCPQGATCGVDVRGAAPGTRETDLLRPDNLVEQVHALLLTGGPARVPIVPAAVLFDLWIGDPRIRPDAAAGHAACEAASRAAPHEPPAQGSVGAGAGASVGKLFGIERGMKGGIGTASLTVGAVTVGALVAVNPSGDVIDPATGRVVAGTRGADGRPRSASRAIAAGEIPPRALPGMATTIGIVATDAQLSKAQCQKLASMSHNGLARSIDPVHTMADGDTLFALATGASGRPGEMTVLGILAATVTARAVLNAVRAATGLADPPLPSARDLGLA
jgi:L-aminopeptidase/D-esterase-like protein